MSFTSIHRAALLLSLGSALLLWSPSESHAQDAEKRAQAEELNNQGKQRIKQLDLEGAAARFRAAMQLVDDPRYAFNLCYTLDKSNKLEEARVACQDVVSSGDPRLGEKAAALLETIDAKLAQGAGPGPENTPPDTSEPVVQPPEPPEPIKSETPPAPRFAGMVGAASANVNAEVTTTARLGLALGGTFLVADLPSVDLIADAQLVQRGFSSFVSDIELTANLTYFDLGFAARYSLGQSLTKPYLEFGTTLCVLVTSSATVGGMDSDVNASSIDVATTLGVGMRIGTIDLRARLLMGLIDINSNSSDSIAQTGTTNRVTTVQAGYWF